MPQLDNGKVVQFNEETASSITKPKSLNAVKPVSKIVEIASKIAVNNVKIIKKTMDVLWMQHHPIRKVGNINSTITKTFLQRLWGNDLNN